MFDFVHSDPIKTRLVFPGRCTFLRLQKIAVFGVEQLNFVGVTVDPDRRYIHFPSSGFMFSPVAVGEKTTPTQVSGEQQHSATTRSSTKRKEVSPATSRYTCCLKKLQQRGPAPRCEYPSFLTDLRAVQRRSHAGQISSGHDAPGDSAKRKLQPSCLPGCCFLENLFRRPYMQQWFEFDCANW